MFFKLSRFQYFLALPFYQAYSWIHLVFDFQHPSSWLSKNMCVCFVSYVVYFRFIYLLCGTIVITQALNYEQGISLREFPFSHQSAFPMFSEKNIFKLFIVLFSPPPPPVFVCAKQAAVQPCILPVNYFLNHKQCSCETFNYLCWWHLLWPTLPRFLPSPPCLSGNFLKIICMCVISELKGKRKRKVENKVHMCMNSSNVKITV